MKKLSHDEIAVQRLKHEEIKDDHRLPVIAILDSVRSLYNVGSMFRTADGVLLKKLILTGFTPHPPRKEIEKTALGSTRSVPWEYCPSSIEAITCVKSEGYKMCCLELAKESIPYYGIKKADFPLCLIVGNEINGVSKDLMAHCEIALEIPMFGTKQSLNVAVAFGISIFELSRVWRSA